MTRLSRRSPKSTMDGMSTRTIEVDFHLKADTEHTFGLLEDLRPLGPIESGQRVLATDGEVTHWAIVDGSDDNGSLLLRVLWDEAVRPDGDEG
jgi:hypothetical protein